MFVKITSLATLPDYILLVGFSTDEYKKFDIKPLIKKYPPFKALLETEGLYEQAKIDVGGYGIVWNDYLDLSADGVYEQGVTCRPPDNIEIYKQRILEELVKVRKDAKLSQKQLEDRVLRDFAENQNKEISNVIGALTPYKLGLQVLKQAQIPQDTKVNGVTKEMRKSLCHTLKSFTINIDGTRPIDEAIITRGGVNVKEINPKTFESKLVSGLYFAGEILDVDAYTGGYNLQIAFSSAYSAAQNAAIQ